MKRALLLAAVSLAAAPAAALSQTAADSAAIRAAALDYAEGWYEGDAARMQRAVHPDLAKRIPVTDRATGRSALQPLTAAALVGHVATGEGKRTPPAQQQKDVEILDVFRDVASVKTTMVGWVDYMHLAKMDGRWVIVNVLWQMKPRAPQG